MSTLDFTNPKKAATLVVSLGTDRAEAVLSHLSDEEVATLASEVAALGTVDPDTHLSVLKEALGLQPSETLGAVGGPAEARRLLSTRRGLANDISRHLVNSSAPFSFIHEIEAEQLTQFLKSEHPQTSALILAHQRPSFAARVLADLDPTARADIAYRIATLGRTSKEPIATVEYTLRSRLDAGENETSGPEDGPKGLAQILNNGERSIEKSVLEYVAKVNEPLAEQIRALMFVFEDIVALDDRSIQEVLKNVDTKTLAVALKGASEDVSDAIERNLSERARESLAEEVDLLGPVLRSDVERAGVEVVAIVRGLEADGSIVINRGEGDFIE